MPVLPPFQPAHVHYKPRQKSDDSLHPAVLTTLIVVCVCAILIPLGFGGYYVYGKLSEASQLTMSDSATSTSATNSNSQQGFSTTPSTESMDTTPIFKDFGAQASAGRKTPPSSDSVGDTATAKPQPDSATQTDSTTFAVPELNPPKLIQPEPSLPQITPTPNSTPMTSSPMTSAPMPSGNSNASQVQVSFAGPGTSQSGLPIPLQRFVGSNGVLIFVLHSKGHSIANGIQELTRTLSIPDMHAEGGSDHTTIGIRYAGTVDSVVQGIRFGRVSYVDEESRSIHVQVN